MKKELILVGITLVLITAGLSGCTNDNGGNSKNKFVGTWTAIGSVSVQWYEKLVIYEDGLASLIYYTSDSEVPEAATWSVDAETNRLIFNLTDRVGGARYFYSFSNDETLVLTIQEGYSTTYKKS